MIATIITGFVCFLAGLFVAHITWRDMTLDAGATYYYVNPKTGKRSFRWFKYHHD